MAGNDDGYLLVDWFFSDSGVEIKQFVDDWIPIEDLRILSCRFGVSFPIGLHLLYGREESLFITRSNQLATDTGNKPLFRKAKVVAYDWNTGYHCLHRCHGAVLFGCSKIDRASLQLLEKILPAQGTTMTDAWNGSDGKQIYIVFI